MTGCQTAAQTAAKPAFLKNTDDATLAKLSSAVSQALDNRPINLRAEQLEGRSSFTVAPAGLAMRKGVPIDGRSGAMPDRFDIIKAGRRSYIIHRATGQKIELKNISVRTASSR